MRWRCWPPSAWRSVWSAAPARAAQSTSGTEYSDALYERSDIGDCDAEDRRKQEMPDCGRLVNGTYQEWDWVRAGRVTPPGGWSPPRQQPPGYSPNRSTGTGTGTGTLGGPTNGSTAGATGGRLGEGSSDADSSDGSSVDRPRSGSARPGGSTSGRTQPGSRPRSGRR